MRRKARSTGKARGTALWMRKGVRIAVTAMLTVSVVAFQPPKIVEAARETSSKKYNHWETYNGKAYWYEGGVKQGTYDDQKGVIGDGTVRGREIYDPGSNAWYWLDACYDGAKASSKEVWMPYIYQDEKNWDDAKIAKNAASSGDMAAQVEREIKESSGKWVRYDAEGRMIKGWYTVKGADIDLYPRQAGNTYYYDQMTGLMAKGRVNIDGKEYVFDDITGKLIEGEAPAESRSVLEKVITYESDGSSYVSTQWEYDSAGRMTKETSYKSDGSIRSWSEKEYDSAGRETKASYQNFDENKSHWYEYEYDSAGNLTKEVHYNSDGSIDYEYKWEYDSVGREIKQIQYQHDGRISNWYEYEYDSAGNKKTKEVHYNFDGTTIVDWREYRYDSEGFKTEDVYYSNKGRHVWVESEYDSTGKRIKTSYFYGSWGWDEYEYDSAGNLTKRIYYAYGLENYHYSTSVWYMYRWDEYGYDSVGNITTETWYNADGSVSNRYEYEYDSVGNKTKEVRYNADGSISSWHEWNSAGKPTKYVYYNADGSIGSWAEYDSAGNSIKGSWHTDYAGSIGGWFEYEYNSAGNKTKYIQYNFDGTIHSWTEYEYKTITIR